MGGWNGCRSLVIVLVISGLFERTVVIPMLPQVYKYNYK
jgi:hypothetical protein